MKKTFLALASDKPFWAIAIGLPVALTIIAVPMQRLGYRPLSKQECQVKKWQLPKSVPSQDKKSPVLVQRSPITCCEGDTSCLDKQLWGEGVRGADKKALLTSIAQSLQYLQTEKASSDYQNYPVVQVTRDRVINSLQRFRQLLLKSKSAGEFNQAIAQEFVLYQSVGSNGKGRVLFTAYYEPQYTASRVPTAEYRYPMYRVPPDLDKWQRPHPTRLDLEGADGLQGKKGKLRGLELFWFRDRLEPFMVQIQGSAVLQLTDGTQTTVGYAGNIAQDYKSIGRELANDGKLPLLGMTMPIILDYFHKYPEELNVYIPRDPSFVFFEEKHGAPAGGSINVPLTAERSIATDKSLMPPGALALIRASFPFVEKNGNVQHRLVSRYVLDQDAGGAIKGSGRVDYFLGTGKIAGDRAGVTVTNGHLYYLLLKLKS
ncbi:MAG: MltA domain-containing protein [Cyanomargarita calcarea GSE-NOS-MK-12-04C]|jgi:membrane-bound lytic murein transglycosylase A|uniref:peptidoglycan lytic exotransglycosylase n=1 Tax=Cyanomargarita calcarea GSE-NOS-MK-12-04C TaxID=2839659 RepID=A0A951UUC0_9CYAN|nr:MltA domain-containing protein [Cyanomargarita calcarea GSE-NOS-MK-12-04C]